MSNTGVENIRSMVLNLLGEHGHAGVSDSQALFSSGLLDSVAATQVLLALETDFGVDLADEDFDITEIDTLQSLESFVASRIAA